MADERLQAKRTAVESKARRYSLGRGASLTTEEILEKVLSDHTPGGVLAASKTLRFTLASRDGRVFTYFLDKIRFPVEHIRDVSTFKAHLKAHAEIIGGGPT